VQTFLPYPDFKKSAQSLDNVRLRNQRRESLTLLRIVAGINPEGGWRNHPACKMWVGYPDALAVYSIDICLEVRRRGFNDTCLPIFLSLCKNSCPPMPRWFGYEPFHVSHMSNLSRKLPEHYSAQWPSIPDDLPYVWPSKLKAFKMPDSLKYLQRND
jgi:Pyrimidine dimer DNA glycosylase